MKGARELFLIDSKQIRALIIGTQIVIMGLLYRTHVFTPTIYHYNFPN